MAKRRARPPRHLIIHLKDRNGNLVDYMTAEYQLKDILAKYEMVIKSLNEAGFTQVSSNIPVVAKSVPQVTTEAQGQFCAVCGQPMEFKQGISAKTNKPWKGYFCKIKEHKPQWLK